MQRRKEGNALANVLAYGAVGVVVVVVALAVMAVSAWALMWALNLLTPLFGGPQLTFWHAVALLVVLSFIGNLFRGSSGKKD